MSQTNTQAVKLWWTVPRATYCWWKKSCTGAGIWDNTLWHVPPHPLFNVVFSSPVRRCRIWVIQLLCFGDKFFLPMLNGEHEGQDSKCVWWCRIFSINRLQKSCLLVFWPSCSVAACSHVRLYGCMYVCTYVCMYVCMYVSTYVLTLGYFYVEIFSGFFTAFAGQSQFIDIDGDMWQLQFRNLFLFSSSAIHGFCKVLYVSSLSWAHVCVLTVHAQCTYSAHTVHGHSARARNAANTMEKCP